MPKCSVPIGTKKDQNQVSPLEVFFENKTEFTDFYIFLVIFYFTKQIEIYVTLIIFALVHEMAHIIVGITYGLKPKTLKNNSIWDKHIL